MITHVLGYQVVQPASEQLVGSVAQQGRQAQQNPPLPQNLLLQPNPQWDLPLSLQQNPHQHPNPHPHCRVPSQQKNSSVDSLASPTGPSQY